MPYHILMNFHLNQRVFSRVLLGGVVLLLVLSFIPASGGTILEVVIDKAGTGAVRDKAFEYLMEQREQALEGFLVLSALKVGLAILRSSEIGLILNVRIGDVAVAVYDYVDFAWKVLLAAVAYYYLAEFLLELAGTVDVWFVWIGLICSLLVIALAQFRKGPGKPGMFLSRTGAAAFVSALILYLGLPLAFVGAGWVSVHITGGTIKDANRVFAQLEDDMPGVLKGDADRPPARSEIRTPSVTVPVPYDGTDPTQAVIDDKRVEEGLAQLMAGLGPREKLVRLRDYLEERSRALASAVLHQTAAYLFNIVVFPLLSILALYWGGKHVLAFSTPALSSFQNPEVSRQVSRLADAVARLEKTVPGWKKKE